MIWMPRLLMFAALCLLPAVALAQEDSAEKEPAPGEPGSTIDQSESADVDDTDLGESGTIDRYLREASSSDETDSPEGTEPQLPGGADPADETTGTDSDDSEDPADAAGKDRAAADVTAQFDQLRKEIEGRLAALEQRLDEQTARIDALSTTVTANKPTEGDEEAMEERDAVIARLKADLDQLRTDIGAQLRDISEGAAGETTTSAKPVVTVEGHRLRIHNTTGAEQPISINGVRWTVRADEWSSVPIPRGPVTVHRPDHDPLEIAAEEIAWQSDRRGYYFDYDLDGHRLAEPAEE